MSTELTVLNERIRPSKASREDVDPTSSKGCDEALAEALEVRS